MLNAFRPTAPLFLECPNGCGRDRCGHPNRCIQGHLDSPPGRSTELVNKGLFQTAVGRRPSYPIFMANFAISPRRPLAELRRAPLGPQIPARTPAPTRPIDVYIGDNWIVIPNIRISPRIRPDPCIHWRLSQDSVAMRGLLPKYDKKATLRIAISPIFSILRSGHFIGYIGRCGN